MANFKKDAAIICIGRGRLGNFLKNYYELIAPKLRFELVSARDFLNQPSLDTGLLIKSTHIFLTAKDQMLPQLLDQIGQTSFQGKVVHFSGSIGTLQLGNLVVESCHPIMSFTQNAAKDSALLSNFSNVPFACSQNGGDLKERLPMLNNPWIYLAAEKRPLYHFYLSCLGNLSSLLIEECAQDLKQKLDLPTEALLPYLEQIHKNQIIALSHGNSQLSGPLVRGDWVSVNKHQVALASDDSDFAPLYREFIEFFKHRKSLYSNEGIENAKNQIHT